VTNTQNEPSVAHPPAWRSLPRDTAAIWRLLRRSRTPLLSYLALLFAVAGMGFSAILVKRANLPGPVFGFYRMMIAISLSSVLFRAQARRSAPLSQRHVRLSVLAGLLLATDIWFWNNAVLITSAANATLFANTSVVWVALGTMVLFKERLRPAFWIGLVLALCGILVILGQDLLVHPTLGRGDLMALVAGLFYGAFFLAASRARMGLNAFDAWWISSFASAMALLAICLALKQPFLGYSLGSYVCVFLAAVLTQLGGYLAVNYALGHLPAPVVSLTLLGQPVVTAILAVPLLGQPIARAQLLGGAAVLAGIIIVHRAGQRS